MAPVERITRAVRALLGVTAGVLWLVVALTHGVAIVGGGSMRPVLHSGDIVVYRRGAQNVAVGDLVVFTHPGWSGGVVHRVVSIARNGSLVTRGDANATEDSEPVSRDRVKGVAMAVVPTGKAVDLVTAASKR